MHLGGNHRWVPTKFENNNNNNDIYRAHKFYFSISSAVSSIQLHSQGQILPFSWAKNPRVILWSKTLFWKELFI